MCTSPTGQASAELVQVKLNLRASVCSSVGSVKQVKVATAFCWQ